MTIETKWPRLLVVGDPVSEELAAEIILRTTDWDAIAYTNDQTWVDYVYYLSHRFAGAPKRPAAHTEFSEWHGEEWRVYRHESRTWCSRRGVLDLHYLHNEQIVSSWVFGPHGWIDWAGNVGCATYNLGKWPTDEDITEDWREIAQAFPTLNLISQCVDDEGARDYPAVEWQVRDGHVDYDPHPPALVTAPSEPDYERLRDLGFDQRERGVPEAELRRALTRWTMSQSRASDD